MNELVARTEKDASGKLTSLSEVKYDVRKDIADIIQENLEVSENKFQALKVNIRTQMEQTVRREGDRIIGSLLAGPQDRIIDPVSARLYIGLSPSNYLVVERLGDLERDGVYLST